MASALKSCHKLQTLVYKVPRNITKRLIVNAPIVPSRRSASATAHLLEGFGKCLLKHVFLQTEGPLVYCF